MPSSSKKLSRCHPYSPDPQGQWKQTFSGREGPKQTLSSQTSRCRGARRQEGWRTGRVHRGPSCPHRTGESRQVSLACVLSCEATGRPAFGGDMSDPRLHQGNGRGPGGTLGTLSLQGPSHTVRSSTCQSSMSAHTFTVCKLCSRRRNAVSRHRPRMNGG